MEKSNKIHWKDIGDDYWEVFVTDDDWDTFSFIMRSETEPTKKQVEGLCKHESIHAKQMVRVI